MTESDSLSNQNDDGSRLSFWLIAIPLLPVLYALSVGPAVALMVRFQFLADAIAVIYYPLEVVLEVVVDTPWGEPLEWYIQKYVEWWAGI
ncbi:MAG: hypothetical protein O2955_11340 [Planctomycetota bacterium]|nr:hypothetical protein [Planctomycetota bacterium]MDA1213107.1 hypothetical protein [Planctomycetota bacterium]